MILAIPSEPGFLDAIAPPVAEKAWGRPYFTRLFVLTQVLDQFQLIGLGGPVGVGVAVVNNLPDIDATTRALNFKHVGFRLGRVEIFNALRTNSAKMRIVDNRLPYAGCPFALLGRTIGLAGAGGPALATHPLPFAPIAINATYTCWHLAFLVFVESPALAGGSCAFSGAGLNANSTRN